MFRQPPSSFQFLRILFDFFLQSSKEPKVNSFFCGVGISLSIVNIEGRKEETEKTMWESQFFLRHWL